MYRVVVFLGNTYISLDLATLTVMKFIVYRWSSFIKLTHLMTFTHTTLSPFNVTHALWKGKKKTKKKHFTEPFITQVIVQDALVLMSFLDYKPVTVRWNISGFLAAFSSFLLFWNPTNSQWFLTTKRSIYVAINYK